MLRGTMPPVNLPAATDAAAFFGASPQKYVLPMIS
jgi:hypothetical protein